MFTILKIVHTRPDVSSRQLPPYSNSGKLLITDSFAQHAVSTSTVATRRAACAHIVTWRTRECHRVSNKTSRPWQSASKAKIRPNYTLVGHLWKLGEGWAKYPSQHHEAPSSLLHHRPSVLKPQCVKGDCCSASRPTLALLDTVKFTERMGKMWEWILRVWHTVKPLMVSWPSGFLKLK